ncbi:RHS repeat domain-containing protein [Kitasatospora sp. NPDC088783]|uniref:RHS repeat domain-containing protein n=1 Tax=Kitasatospora sp. NPDC088783 TaxID=3364077 RepID=UPI00382A0817
MTSEKYDALGRVTAVYLPGQSAPNPPNLKYGYTVSNSAASTVSTYTLNDDSTYRQTEVLYDALLRARETQTQLVGGGRMITDTIYNTDGWKSVTTDSYYNGAPVDGTYVQAQIGDVPSALGFAYDGAGRRVTSTAYANGTETWHTTTTYGGNFTTVVPPAGRTPSTSVVDARGRQTDLIQYKAGMPTDYVTDPPADYTDTKYTYTPDGQKATERDPAGNTWSWGYNLLGKRTDNYDPDTGHAVLGYDAAGQLTTSTDARGRQSTTTYDADGRRTGVYDTTTTQALTSANKLAGWVYDTLKKGMLTSSTSYSNGDTYTSAVLAYNSLGKPSASKVTLTGEAAGLIPAAGLTTTYGYTLTGALKTQNDPAEDGLPAETLTYQYDQFGRPTQLGSSGGASWTYVSSVGYSNEGQPVEYRMGPTTSQVWTDLTYDPQTHNLTDVQTKASTVSGTIDDLRYNFGNSSVSKGAGLLTSVVDSRNAGTAVDTQCFQYDYADRVQQAWSATDNCAATPAPGSSAGVGGPVSPYWQSWTYDAAGNRTTQTDHNPAGSITNDTTTTYSYPAAGSATDQPHTLTGTTATGPAATDNTATYHYDTAGNTTSITGGVLGNQTLSWNTRGKLDTDTTSAGTTYYVYDADGSLLVRRGPGSTTLYAGDAQLVYDTGTQTASGTRFYGIAGATVASRTSAGTVSYLIPDRQGSDQLAVDASSQAVTRRQFLPFGTARGTSSTWVGGDLGYVGGHKDAVTGLENLGAREYDPVIGRFLSVDPLLESGDPNQTNGYAYSGNDPVTGADPTGLRADSIEPGDCGAACVQHNIDIINQANADTEKYFEEQRAAKQAGQVRISQHVSIAAGNPHAAGLKAAWEHEVARFGHLPKDADEEYRTWRAACRVSSDCTPYMIGALGMGASGALDGGGSGDMFENGAMEVTETGTVRSLKDPQSMRGATREEVRLLAEEAGFVHQPMNERAATGGEGDLYRMPGESGVTIMWEKGDPSAYGDPVHHGPYIKYQVSKKANEGKAVELRVPADGNPDPSAGSTGQLPARAQGWLDEKIPEPGAAPGEIDFPGTGAAP